MSLLRRTQSALPLLERLASHVRTPHTAREIVRCRRSAGTLSSLPTKSRVSTVFTALTVLGVGSTAFGLYQFYATFMIWPKEVRGDLRAGIKAKNQGDLGMSEKFLQRALETAQTLPLEQLSPYPHLKLSGIAIALAGVLEDDQKPREAYDVYSAALHRLKAAKGLSGKERLRAVSIAHKLGEMAETYQQPVEEEEKWLVYAVEEMLRILRDEQAASRTATGGEANTSAEADQIILDELELPSWVEETDVVSPLQALGSFYSRVGKQEYAIPLYLSVLSVLMPIGAKRITTENRCRGADVMNSVANTLLVGEPTPQRREQAEAWVKKALAVIADAKDRAKSDTGEAAHCDLVLAAALFNHGSLREMAGDLENARKLFMDSRRHSSQIKLRDGVIQADMAVRRVDRLSRAKEPGVTPTMDNK